MFLFLDRIFQFFNRYRNEQVLLWLAAFLFLVATNTQAGLLYIVIACIIGMLFFSLFASIFNLRKLKITRILPVSVVEDDEAFIKIRVRNNSRLPKFMLLVEDPFPTLYTGQKSPRMVIPHIPPHAEAEVAYKRRAYQRGIYPIDQIRLETSGFLGFFFMSRKFKTPGERLIVLPRPLHPMQSHLAVLSHLLHRGEYSMKLRGFSFDFTGITEYRPGMDMRLIHWPSTAHHNRLMVKEFSESAAYSVSVLVDTRQSSNLGEGRRTTGEYCIKAAADLLQRTHNYRGDFNLFIPRKGRVAEYKKISLQKGMFLLADTKFRLNQAIDGFLPEVADKLKFGTQFFICKIFPFKRLEGFLAFSRKKIRTTVVFFRPADFLSPEDPLYEGLKTVDYSGQIEELRQMGIHAFVYSPVEIPKEEENALVR